MARSALRNLDHRKERVFKWGFMALLAGAVTGIGWIAMESSFHSAPTNSLPSTLKGSTALPPLDATLLSESSALEPALRATSDATTIGTAESLDAAGVLTIQADVDITKTQEEQGLDDGSGLTYPCVFIGDPTVCQRQLTSAEAASEGK